MRTLLLMIAELYGVEKLVRQRGLSGEGVRLLREQGARPVLDKLHVYLLQIREELLPKSEAGQAANYILKNWTALTRYCESPDLSIDNNHTERSLRGWAVGRNNWIFFGSDRGGKTPRSRAAQFRRLLRTGEGGPVRLVSGCVVAHSVTSHHPARRVASASLGASIVSCAGLAGREPLGKMIIFRHAGISLAMGRKPSISTGSLGWDFWPSNILV